MSSADTERRAEVLVTPLDQGRRTELTGTVLCPPDKSVTHRSMIFAAMAKGASRVERPLLGADCLATMEACRRLGVEVIRDVDTGAVVIRSPGWDRWQTPASPLDFGNSGTTARLLTGVLAASDGLFVTAFGDQSLSRRPMGRVVEPLRAAGAEILGRDGGRLLPLAIRGRPLRPLAHTVDKASAQVKSALLLAGLRVAGQTSVTLPAGGRDHTERMLQALGAKLTVASHGIGTRRLETVTITGPFTPAAGTFRVPGDPSSAAFLVILGVLAAGQLTVAQVLDNPTRTGFLVALGRMGAKIEPRAPTTATVGLLEPQVDLVVAGGAPLLGIDLEPELAPTLIDEIPVLAVAAAFATGPSRFRGLGELRVKESDRLSLTCRLLADFGAKAWTEGDDLCVAGGLLAARPFTFDPEGDHRLAMAAAVAAKVATGPCRIIDPECTAVSFPGFFDVLKTFS